MHALLVLPLLLVGQTQSQLDAKANAEGYMTGMATSRAMSYNAWESADCAQETAVNDRATAVAAMGNPALISFGDEDYARGTTDMGQGNSHWDDGEFDKLAADGFWSMGMDYWNAGNYSAAVGAWSTLDSVTMDAATNFNNAKSEYENALAWFEGASSSYYSSHQ